MLAFREVRITNRVPPSRPFGRFGETGTVMVSRGAEVEASKGREPGIGEDRRFGNRER